MAIVTGTQVVGVAEVKAVEVYTILSRPPVPYLRIYFLDAPFKILICYYLVKVNYIDM